MRTRFTLTRDSYKNVIAARCSGIKSWTQGKVDITTYTSERGHAGALVFVGKANKPAIYAVYSTPDSRDSAVMNIIENIDRHDRHVAERRAERSAPHTLKIGDILTCSWGYDQTNVDWYQVVALKGTKMVTVREIGARYTDGYSSVVPVKDKFIGEAKDYRVNGQHNSIAAYSFASASPWDGRPEYVTPAGMGH